MISQLGQEEPFTETQGKCLSLLPLDQKEQEGAADSSWACHTRNSTQPREEATGVKLTFISSTQLKPTQKSDLSQNNGV